MENTDYNTLPPDPTQARVSESDGDDIWNDDDDDTSDVNYDRSIAERNWKRLQETHGVLGYKEGIVEGKDESLQKGFSMGFSEGAVIGHELGRLRGIVR
jgi:flagellar biosynthesis/type III secretory pathway protein FliH